MVKYKDALTIDTSRKYLKQLSIIGKFRRVDGCFNCDLNEECVSEWRTEKGSSLFQVEDPDRRVIFGPSILFYFNYFFVRRDLQFTCIHIGRML